MSGKIKEINADNFKAEVLDKKTVIVDFYSTECPPCEALAPKYKALSELYGNDISFVKIFRQENRSLAEKLGVTGSPTVLFYQNGKLKDDKLTGGIKRSELINNLNNLLSKERVEIIQNEIKQIETETDVVILGGGPAGLTAGIYLAQAHIKTILIDITLPGGYVATTHQVSNYPGFIEPQNGYMLSHYMSEQAKQNGVEFRAAVDVNSVNLNDKIVKIDGFETIKAKKIIIATGSRPKLLGIPGEIEYRGNGISYCATCDGKYYQDKEIIVIGGGNSAIEESLFLSKFAKKITIVHQFAELQANKEAQKKAFNNEKIEFLFEHEPREFIRYDTYDMGVIVVDLKSKKRMELKTNGVFIFAGFTPNIDIFKEKLKLDKWGYLNTNDEMQTNIDGVYAVGDVKTKAYRQITTAVADGTIAAISISKEFE